MKPRLLFCEPVSLTFDEFLPYLQPWFDVQQYDEDNIPDASNTVVVIPYFGAGTWAFDLQQQGYRVAIDNLFEPSLRYMASPGYHVLVPDLTYEIRSDVWFWCHEHIRLRHYRSLGGEPEYCPNRTFERLAFMPMRLSRWHRDRLLEIMQPLLSRCYYSYQETGHFLPNDLEPLAQWAQRYFHASWYDHTWFSIVAETFVDEYNDQYWGHEQRIGYCGPWPFLSEKTFKPIALEHPFMIWGHSGTLRKLRDLGFETFENLFDESDDDAGPWEEKLKIIYNNANSFDTKHAGYDGITLEKIQHNHAVFFDRQRINSMIMTDIINPLLQYAYQT